MRPHVRADACEKAGCFANQPALPQLLYISKGPVREAKQAWGKPTPGKFTPKTLPNGFNYIDPHNAVADAAASSPEHIKKFSSSVIQARHLGAFQVQGIDFMVILALDGAVLRNLHFANLNRRGEASGCECGRSHGGHCQTGSLKSWRWLRSLPLLQTRCGQIRELHILDVSPCEMLDPCGLPVVHPAHACHRWAGVHAP